MYQVLDPGSIVMNERETKSLPSWGFYSSGRRQTTNKINKELCQIVFVY